MTLDRTGTILLTAHCEIFNKSTCKVMQSDYVVVSLQDLSHVLNECQLDRMDKYTVFIALLDWDAIHGVGITMMHYNGAGSRG